MTACNVIDSPILGTYKISLPLGSMQQLNLDHLHRHGLIDAGNPQDIVGRIKSATVTTDGFRKQLLVVVADFFDNPIARKIRRDAATCEAYTVGLIDVHDVLHVERFVCSVDRCGYVCLIERHQP